MEDEEEDGGSTQKMTLNSWTLKNRKQRAETEKNGKK